MRVGIVGGGINGLCSALVLAEAGHAVTLYERGSLMGATSRSSSKLLHGGLRYLETGQLRLVREALRERDAWLERAPAHTRELGLILPLYRGARRGRLLVGAGLALYDLLALGSPRPRSRWLDAAGVLARAPGLGREGLRGGYLFHDGQMDDHALGLWVAERCRAAGVQLIEEQPVDRIGEDGTVSRADASPATFDAVVNACGPWAGELLERSGIASGCRVDPVRGSHLVLERPCAHALLLQHADGRVVFVLPWRGGTLVGTTEVRQTLTEPVACSRAERDYLLSAYNLHFECGATAAEIRASFAGVRPLVRQAGDPSRASRSDVIETHGRVVSVFGGKWTTAMALAGRVARQVQSMGVG